ncbi:hypothetical protein M409DRAFT_27074 [Zasmidium cellare ATCC 36951]|uniref:DJ-1/PfpI domain-containing protein n=1 Tax=Zasmidium cellare ATCC 36951 TaxID=1080233 RepID=A0A6A6C884_ZASCE|nr:uncharacterized protein M409DRAFT_27074 [Zasmidium cellare ATCC 36951]KAF2162450.1 hypothetical protein M409DRAFT_27074 [Zasmidium cellare ATCC 36951]
MTESFNLSWPNRKIHAGVILLNSVTEILDVAPFHLMGTMSKHLKDMPDSVYAPDLKEQALDIECHWVNESGEPAQLASGMRVLPTDTFASCPPLDIVLMGANNMDYQPSISELAFIRKAFEDSSAFIAVCGAFRSLLLSGLLEGKTATAPRGMLKVSAAHRLRQIGWRNDGVVMVSFGPRDSL